MTTPIPFAAQAYQLRAVQFAAQRCVNLYPELGPPGSKTPLLLQATPGLTTYATVGSGPIRGLIEMQGFVFVVSDNRLFRLDVNGVQRDLGFLPGTGLVKMADNGDQILILTGTSTEDGWIATTEDLTQITDEDFLGGSDCDFIDGYFVISRPNSNEFYISALYNGLEYDPLDFARAEGAPDNIVGLIVDHREIWLIGQETTEVWYNAGNADFPFERASGTFIERGTSARDSIYQIDNTIMWVGDDRIVYRADGYSPIRVSTHAIEQKINESIGTGDLVSFAYSQEGHAQYVLKKPGEWTFVYDVATQLWHERCSCDREDYKISTYVSAFDRLLVGDDLNGSVYFLDAERPGTEDSGTVVSRMASPPLFANEETAVLNALVVDLERGEGNDGPFFQTSRPDLVAMEGYGRTRFEGATSVASMTVSDVVTPDLDKTVSVLGVAAFTLATAGSPVSAVSATFDGQAMERGENASGSDGTNTIVIEYFSLGEPEGSGDVVVTFDGTALDAVIAVLYATDLDLGKDELFSKASGSNAASISTSYTPDHPKGLTISLFGGGTKGGDVKATKPGHVLEGQLIQNSALVAAVGTQFTQDQDSKDIGFERADATNYDVLALSAPFSAATDKFTRAPQIMLRYSNDAGKTWSSEKWRSMGKVGEYKRRARWNRMGQFRQRVLELSISDPIPRFIMGAYAKIERGGL